MSQIQIKNSFLITNILKKTQANLFKDMVVGDVFKVSLTLTSSGNTYGYAPYLSIAYGQTKREISVNEFKRILRSFTVQELH